MYVTLCVWISNSPGMALSTAGVGAVGVLGWEGERVCISGCRQLNTSVLQHSTQSHQRT